MSLNNTSMLRPIPRSYAAPFAFLALGISSAQAQQPPAPLPTAGMNTSSDITASCKQQAHDFVYPPPKNEKQREKQEEEQRLAERLRKRPEWMKLLEPDYKGNMKASQELSKFNDCLRRNGLAFQGAKLQQADGSVRVQEIKGRLFATVDSAYGKLAIPLMPVATEGGKPSESLFEHESPDHRTQFFYREHQSDMAREVVPVEDKDAKNTYLDRNGQFMLTLSADGDVTYVPTAPAKPKPAQPPPTLYRSDEEKLVLAPQTVPIIPPPD